MIGVENLGDIFAKRSQRAMTLRAAVTLRLMLNGLAFQMFGEWLAGRLVALAERSAERFYLLLGRLKPLLQGNSNWQGRKRKKTSGRIAG
jgi:hypothetical protein